MKLMICMHGEPQQLGFLPEIAQLGAGIELGSYGLVGVRSQQDWDARLMLHQSVRSRFDGPLAIHGPFIGLQFSHVDCLIREAIKRRMDMTFDAARRLRASRVVLHGGHTPEVDIFKFEEFWIKGTIDFWRKEIDRWADAGIEIVIENNTEASSDSLVKIAGEVDSPFLGLCLDVGHQHVFSRLGAAQWVRMMSPHLRHVHLHDNDGTADSHRPLGQGTIDFEPFFAAIAQHAPSATLSLEVEDTMETKISDLRKLSARLA